MNSDERIRDLLDENARLIARIDQLTAQRDHFEREVWKLSLCIYEAERALRGEDDAPAESSSEAQA